MRLSSFHDDNVLVRLVLALLVTSVSITTLQPLRGQTKAGSGPARIPRFDRITAIVQFLAAIYPELRDKSGRVTLETDDILGRGPLYVGVRVCRTNSGVAGGVPSAAGDKRQSPDVRMTQPCGPAFSGQAAAFFAGDFTTGSSQYPIYRFAAGGELVGAELRAVQQDIQSHPNWTQEEILAHLRTKRPRFGPDSRDALIKSIPTEAIRQFTGCRLQPKDSLFMPANPKAAEGDWGLTWRVPGQHVEGRREVPCLAYFEPFEGKLLRLDQL